MDHRCFVTRTNDIYRPPSLSIQHERRERCATDVPPLCRRPGKQVARLPGQNFKMNLILPWKLGEGRRGDASRRRAEEEEEEEEEESAVGGNWGTLHDGNGKSAQAAG